MRLRSRTALRLLIVLFLVVTGPPLRAQPANFAIRYHERLHTLTFVANSVRPQALGGAPSSGPSLSFVAFGRRFDVDLRRNDRLTSTLDATTVAKLDGLDVYEGELRNAPRSWVRLTSYRGEWLGVISDGADLYAIEPYASAAAHLVQPDDSSDAPVIYRWKDTTGPVVDEIGPVISEPGSTSPPDPAAAASPSALLSAGEQIDIGLIGDSAFGQSPITQPAEPAMVTMANVADGIFVSQVGVRLNVAQIEMLTSMTDPFDSGDPPTLLSELVSHKAATPTLSGKGLVHLFTGRTFTDTAVVGIAYLRSICEDHSAGITNITTGVVGGLVAAHEIGHNFGAPHDGVPGPCESTPSTYLMSPRINGSHEFSACSLDQISAYIANASCLYAAPSSDVSIRGVTTATQVLVGAPFSVNAFVDSHGGDALAVAVSAVGDGITVNRIIYAGCDTSSSPNCRASYVYDGQPLSVRIDAVANRVGAATLAVAVQSINDSNPLDNDLRVDFDVQATLNLLVDGFSATPTVVHPFDPVDLTLDFSNHGPATATQVVARFHIDNSQFAVLGITSPGGACSESPSAPWIWTCPIGTMAPGSSVHLVVKARDASGTEGARNLFAALESAEPNLGTGGAFTAVQVASVIADLSIAMSSTAFQGVSAGSEMQITLLAHNAGPDAVDNVMVALTPESDAFSLEAIDGHGGSCTPTPYTRTPTSSWDCVFSHVPSGADVSVTYSGKARMQGNGNSSISASVGSAAATLDMDASNNSARVLFTVSEPQPPTAQPAPTTSGGGGGAIDWLSAALLATALAWLKAKRRASG